MYIGESDDYRLHHIVEVGGVGVGVPVVDVRMEEGAKLLVCIDCGITASSCSMLKRGVLQMKRV